AGRILRVTAPDAATLITARDLAGVQPIRPMLHKFNYIPIAQPILADRVVRYVGEPVAAVIADSEEAAEDVVEPVTVKIEEPNPVVDARAALAAGGPAVHDDAPSNVIVEGRVKTPGFDAARAAARTIVKVDLRSHRQNAMPMEPRAAHAAYDAASGRITLTCSTQMPHLMRTVIADLIGMPEAELRV